MSCIIGDKVGAKYLCFIVGESGKELKCAWYSLIQVDGRMVHIKDSAAPRGITAAETRYKAVKLAKQARDRIRSKEREAVSH